MKRLLLVAVLTLSAAVPAFAQHAAFIVRHAERADAGSMAGTMMASDPGLSAAGQERAEALASTLRNAAVAAIFVTEYKRTQQTAAPLARALGLEPVIVSAKDVTTLVSRIKATKGNVLVVGHSNTVGDIISALGVRTPVKVGDREYDNLFVVTCASVLRLTYGS